MALKAPQPAAPTNSNVTVFNDLLTKAFENADAKFAALSSASDATSKQARLPSCEAALKEVQQYKKSYEMEISLMKPAEKGPFRALQEGYDAHLLKLEQQIKMERAWLEKSLLTGGKNDKKFDPSKANIDSTDVRDQLLKQTQHVQGQIGTSLQRTLKTAQETVHIGQQVAEELESQKDQILRIDQGLVEVDDEIKRANLILSAIFRRMATDKLIICISFILFGLIIAVVALVSTGTIKTSSLG